MGSGFKTWVAGERVDADDFQGYVQDQVIFGFATTAARDAAVTTPVEGMVAGITGDDILTVYTGAAWVEMCRWAGSNAWTSTQIDQGVTTNISKTTTTAKYIRQGNVVEAWGNFTITGTGTAGSPVTLQVPVTISGNNTNDSIGSGSIVDTGTPANGGPLDVWVNSSTTVYFLSDGQTARWGQGPSHAISSDNSLRLHIRYLVA